MQLTFPNVTNGNIVYMDVMNDILGYTPRTSMIDLGCHKAAHTPLFNFEKRKYVDILTNTLDFPQEQQYFEQSDILDTPLDVHYSVSFSLDCIEHLTVENGVKLLNIMLTISDKQILFTPLTDLFGMNFETDDPESHRSLWSPEMIENSFPGKLIFICFPKYHSVWNGGAFFFFSCNENIEQEFKRISEKLNTYSWAK